jgi:dinuclear metal center YbgI/SA1388 family protein
VQRNHGCTLFFSGGTNTERIARIQDLVGLAHALYPPNLAESWDNVGLQAGDPAAPLDRVLVCLDPSEQAIEAARTIGAQAVLAHHPLIFQPLRQLTPATETGRILLRAAREGIAVLCAHTNLDRAPGGLNDWLAQRLGLPETVPLGGSDEDLVKLAVFVPAGYEDTVAEALFQGGAGKIGRYDRCSFRAEGTGTFRPAAGTDPFIGRPGVDERVREIRLETIVPRERLPRVIERMLKAHPYEEVAYDLFPLANRRPGIGLGRIGRLAAPTTLDVFAAEVKRALAVSHLRVVGNPAARVGKVALCGGSGASLLPEAVRQGADVLVTGDLKYHEARNAESQGICLIDAGHFATERIAIEGLAAALGRAAQERGLAIAFISMEGEQEPFRVL